MLFRSSLLAAGYVMLSDVQEWIWILDWEAYEKNQL